MSVLITINQIEDGMMLSSSVTNKFGQLLLPAGTTLSANHKKLLKTWGISSVQITEQSGEENSDGVNASILEKAKSLVAERMSWSPSNEVEESLYEMALIKIMEKEF